MSHLNLSDALAQTRTRIGCQCGTGAAISKLTPEQQADVATAMADKGITHAHLARAIALMSGERVNASSVKAHRVGGCQCE